MKCNRWMCAAAAVFSFICAGTAAQAQQGNSNGSAQLYSTSCASCHGADGKGSDRAPGIATMQKVIAMSDADIATIVHDGEAGGMPSFGSRLSDPQIQGIVRYLRTLQGVKPAGAALEPLPGDPGAGAQIFAGKGGCTACHMVKGNGGFIANDLTIYGQTHDAAAIRKVILDSGAKPAGARGSDDDGNGIPGQKTVVVKTKSGQEFTGMVRSEDNLHITVQTMDGQYHFFARAQAASIVYAQHSLMPTDYGTKLSSKEIDDVVSYLLQTARQQPQEAAPARRRRGGN
jgi:cytochrome c oxidase cbb3-type subunit 3